MRGGTAAMTPGIADVRELRQRLRQWLLQTPVVRCPGLEARMGGGAVTAKLEFLQRTGTFKARGALAAIAALEREQLERGVTAVSAGNHAIAMRFGYYAREAGS